VVVVLRSQTQTLLVVQSQAPASCRQSPVALQQRALAMMGPGSSNLRHSVAALVAAPLVHPEQPVQAARATSEAAAVVAAAALQAALVAMGAMALLSWWPTDAHNHHSRIV
jgi:hypothetical protein